jgi:hypothetical protein
MGERGLPALRTIEWGQALALPRENLRQSPLSPLGGERIEVRGAAPCGIGFQVLPAESTPGLAA